MILEYLKHTGINLLPFSPVVDISSYHFSIPHVTKQDGKTITWEIDFMKLLQATVGLMDLVEFIYSKQNI